MSNFMVTDLDVLVSLGYHEDFARLALEKCGGDRKAAINLLTGKVDDKAASAWRTEREDDFVTGLTEQPLPAEATMRALWKSPLYCRIPSFYTDSENVTWYAIRAISKFGETFERKRRYKQIHNFKSSLPIGTCSNFKCSFPLPGLNRFIDIEKRRAMLEDWLREFVLDESIMSNPALLSKLYEFLDLKQTYDRKDFGKIIETSEKEIQRLKIKETNPFDDDAAEDMQAFRLSAVNFKSTTSQEMPTLTAIRSLATVQLISEPIQFRDVNAALPFKANIQPDDENMVGNSGKDESRKQLAKDYQRDRIIIQNHRIEGSKHTLAELVIIMKYAINDVLRVNMRPSLSTSVPEDVKNTHFCLNILAHIARTQSAYSTHNALSKLIKEDPNAPITIVPESSMAEPIKIRFSVKQRQSDAAPGVGEYCVVVEAEAGTVFRFNDPLDDDVATLLQVRAVYCSTAYGMVEVATDGISPRSPHTALATSHMPNVAAAEKRGAFRTQESYLLYKEGKTSIFVEKEMHTSKRDWEAG